MSTKPLQLEAHVQGQRTDELDALRERVADLENEVANQKLQLKGIRQETGKVISRLLSPLYKALVPIFGEIEPEGFAEERASNNSAWDAVKQRIPPKHREVIDVLLLQGEMTRKQIASAIRMNYTNCTNNVIGPLLRQGWLVEIGGKIALKEL